MIIEDSASGVMNDYIEGKLWLHRYGRTLVARLIRAEKAYGKKHPTTEAVIPRIEFLAEAIHGKMEHWMSRKLPNTLRDLRYMKE